MTTRNGIVGTLAGMSAATQRLNAGLLAGPVLSAGMGREVAGIKQEGGKKRIRQKAGDGMNKWEREWRDLVAPAFEHIHREVSLPLANGLRYKLDFLCVDFLGVIVGYEVKGQARSTGIAKLKMAARVYPWIKFVMVSKRRKRDGAGWTKEAVLP